MSKRSIKQNGGESTVAGSHVISFRLPDVTWRELKQVSSVADEGSPSELARDLVCSALSEDSSGQHISLNLLLKKVSVDLMKLQLQLTRLVDTIYRSSTERTSARISCQFASCQLLNLPEQAALPASELDRED